jgi:hypothetical protein
MSQQPFRAADSLEAAAAAPPDVGITGACDSPHPSVTRFDIRQSTRGDRARASLLAAGVRDGLVAVESMARARLGRLVAGAPTTAIR